MPGLGTLVNSAAIVVGAVAGTLLRRGIPAAWKETILAAMGLSVSDAIRLLMLRIADEHRLPFEIKAPSSSSRQALSEIEAGEVQRFTSVADLMADLHADD